MEMSCSGNENGLQFHGKLREKRHEMKREKELGVLRSFESDMKVCP